MKIGRETAQNWSAAIVQMPRLIRIVVTCKGCAAGAMIWVSRMTRSREL